MKNWLIGKEPDAGKDWRQEEKGTTEDEKIGWHHLLNGHKFEKALGIDDARGSLACCSPWGLQRVRHDRETEQNRWVIKIFLSFLYFLDELKPSLADSLTVAKKVWENVFSAWFIKCEPGTHFPGQIIQALTKTLQASWDYHCPYEPQTWGRIDRNNTKTGLWQYKN